MNWTVNRNNTLNSVLILFECSLKAEFHGVVQVWMSFLLNGTRASHRKTSNGSQQRGRQRHWERQLQYTFFYDISCEKKVLDLCCLARLDLLCMRRDVDKFIIEKVTFFRESSKFPKFQIFWSSPSCWYELPNFFKVFGFCLLNPSSNFQIYSAATIK